MIRKIKNRYVLVEASRPVLLDREGTDELSRRLISVLGELSFSATNPRVAKRYDETTFAIKATRSTEGHLMMALAFINEFSGKPVRFYTLRTSGTIAAMTKYYNKLNSSESSAKSQKLNITID